MFRPDFIFLLLKCRNFKMHIWRYKIAVFHLGAVSNSRTTEYSQTAAKPKLIRRFALPKPEVLQKTPGPFYFTKKEWSKCVLHQHATLNSMEAIMKRPPGRNQWGGNRLRRVYPFSKADCDCRFCLYHKKWKAAWWRSVQRRMPAPHFRPSAVSRIRYRNDFCLPAWRRIFAVYFIRDGRSAMSCCYTVTHERYSSFCEVFVWQLHFRTSGYISQSFSFSAP